MSAPSGARIGVVGLAVMGQNLALNIAEKGFTVALYNRTDARTDEACARAQAEGLGEHVRGFHDPVEFVQALAKPRAVVIMVAAGSGVDDTIDKLLPHLAPGDALIDGGNSYYEDTERRVRELAAKGVLFLGMGVSGGELGARHGPSLMPGGSLEAYRAVEEVLTRIAAQTDDGPCVTFCGPGGAGHFVKMIHNGMEYGDMQLTCEAHDLLRVLGCMSAADEAALFEQWNEPGNALASYLLEISALVLRTPDPRVPGGLLLERVDDVTLQKGTGRWTVETAADLGMAAPTLTAGLEARFISADKATRCALEAAMRRAGAPDPGLTPAACAVLGAHDSEAARQKLPARLADALYGAKLAVYAQGFALLRAKAEARGWGRSAAELARIWKGGCIIRAAALSDVRRAFTAAPELPNLLLDAQLAAALAACMEGWRAVVAAAALSGVAAPAVAASLGYVDAMRRGRGPAALAAAQRDLFGSHGYTRTDAKGQQHTEHWGPPA